TFFHEISDASLIVDKIHDFYLIARGVKIISENNRVIFGFSPVQLEDFLRRSDRHVKGMSRQAQQRKREGEKKKRSKDFFHRKNKRNYFFFIKKEIAIKVKPMPMAAI